MPGRVRRAGSTPVAWGSGTLAGCCPRGSEQRAGHRPPGPAEPPGEPRTGTSPLPGKGQAERAGLPGRGTPGQAAGPPREDTTPGVATGSPGCGMRLGVRTGGLRSSPCDTGGHPGRECDPLTSATSLSPDPLERGSLALPVSALPLSHGFPRASLTGVLGWSRTPSGLGASLAASPMWGSAPHPNLPRGGTLWGLTHCVSRKGCGNDPWAWGSPAPQRCVSRGPRGTSEASLLPPSFPTCPPYSGWERPPSSSNNPEGTPQALGCQTLPSGHRAASAGAHLGLGAPCPGSLVALGPPSCPGRGGRRPPAVAPA